MTFTAALDTCVLVPSLQRELLLQLAAEGTYSPHWGSGTLDELDYTLAALDQARGVKDSSRRRQHLLEQMNTAFPGAKVNAPKNGAYNYNLSDPDDQHVVHAAIISKSDVLVTDDKKAGFTSCTALTEAHISVSTAQEFILDTAAAHPESAARAIMQMALRRRNPPLSLQEMLQVLIEKYHDLEELRTIVRTRR